MRTLFRVHATKDFSADGGHERLAMHLDETEMDQINSGMLRPMIVKYDSRPRNV